MEHGLGVERGRRTADAADGVLILVLMEHGLGETDFSFGSKTLYVLILVLMEHGLGEPTKRSSPKPLTLRRF